MKKIFLLLLGSLTVLLLLVSLFSGCGKKEKAQVLNIPLPEHPRPDFQRDAFINLNGKWGFASDSSDFGETAAWQATDSVFTQQITVPFSWASPLSGIGKNNFHIAWYNREIDIQRDGKWRKKRIFLVVGASDFGTKVWLNGKQVGIHEGGYTPFEFDLTPFLQGEKNRLVMKVDDKPVPGRLVGKQVYGQAKGIWQTVYLEGKPRIHIKNFFFSPDIDNKKVSFKMILSEAAKKDMKFFISFKDSSMKTVKQKIPAGTDIILFDIPVPNQHLWSPDDPYLYEADLRLGNEKNPSDLVHTYFGMRKISTVKLPGSNDMYVTLNNKPVYLKMALDQSYHPEGFYTFPTDEFMKQEIMRAKNIGLNGLRIHIKTEIPRKLYWADKLGLLIMQDMPNISGEPDDYAKENWKNSAYNQIVRDFNHPCIFSWVLFNETWGLKTIRTSDRGIYLPKTRAWVDSLYHWAKNFDKTRLVEDNSPCDNDHVETDLNTWHRYLPARQWAPFLDYVVQNTYPGSPWNFVLGKTQTDVPMLNSEFGSVWGYQYGTGDIDLSFEYHIMMNEFRRRQKIAGFVFTEFHDVINEWNGYYHYDRTPKEYGLDELCKGMTLKDFHSDIYLIPGGDFYKVVKPKSKFNISITASFMTDKVPSQMTVKTILHGWNKLGEHKEYSTGQFTIKPVPYKVIELDSLNVTAPDENCVAVLATFLENDKGEVIHRNFIPFRVSSGDSSKALTLTKNSAILTLPVYKFSGSNWSLKQGMVLNGLKVWGTSSGFFEYSFPWPKTINLSKIEQAEFIAELSSRPARNKDKTEAPGYNQSIENITQAGIDPTSSPNSYPMTDEIKHPCKIVVSFNGTEPQIVTLDDDPADHRGLLSWMNQVPGTLSFNQALGALNWRLEEAGTYGYLVRLKISPAALEKAAKEKFIKIRLDVNETSKDTFGGIAVYGENFGRYPLNPTIYIKLK